MGRQKIKSTSETKNLQKEISELIGKLLSYGLTQGELADTLQLYQPEISQLYRKKRVLTIERLKEIKAILTKIVSENINPNERTSTIETQVKPEYNFGTWLYDQLTQLDISILEFANESSLSYQTINLIVTGVTTSPQFRTKQIIQSTLDKLSKERKKKIEKIEDKEIRDETRLFVGLPFKKEEIEQTPDLIGVYAIHDKRGYPTYLGKGKIKTRLKDHSDRISFASDKVATTFSYYIVQEHDNDESKKKADKEAKVLEKILTKFAGNTILLNVQNIEDLTRE